MKSIYNWCLKPFPLCLLTFFLVLTQSCHTPPSPFSKSAEEGLSTYQVANGFKIELIASEPLITDPVDMMIDEEGRMYVVVMPGYPLNTGGSGKIMLLSDTNGDGKMDKSTVFADGLVLPDGIMRWKKGVIITDAPNIIYLEDTDGDGKADKKDTLLTGFALTNPQHNLNNPEYGLDNWIYVAHQGMVKTEKYVDEFGDAGTDIYNPGDKNSPRLPQNANGRTIRFRPDLNKLEMTSSADQFGQTFDQWGHWFGCNNSNQGYQEVIAQRYFERNPNLIISDADQNMSDHLNAPEVFPTTTNPDRQLLTNVGVMTSGCGLTDYLGDAFPAPFNKNVTFIAEPVSNLVHVDVLRDSGASYVASRILEHKEFLTSTDAWARPVNMYIGPDGALYVLDYYRRVIESPEWMSDQAIAAGGLYDGSDKGRIYRITAVDGKKADWTKGLHLGEATDDELVEDLANPNIWWRMTAQRLLVDRSSKAAIPALVKMAGNSSSPMGRLHALWTLEGMGELKPDLILKALEDEEAGIRENGIRLAELHLNNSPELVKGLMSMQSDPNEKVRFQLLLTLGSIRTPEASEARNNLLFKDINDKWVQIAALTAPTSQAPSLLNQVLEKYQDGNPSYASLVQRLSAMIGAGSDNAQIDKMVQKATFNQPDHAIRQAAIINGLAEGMKGNKNVIITNPDQDLVIAEFFETPSKDLRQACVQLLKTNGISNSRVKKAAVAKAALIAGDKKLPDDKRADAIDFISLGDPSAYISLLEKLLVPQEQPVVQLAALRTLGQISSSEVTYYLIKQWPYLTSEIRDEAVAVFMANTDRIKVLIDALEKGKILTSSISFSRSVSLMQLKDENLRKRARTLFTKNEEQAKEINKQYQEALTLEGDTLKGKQIYLQNCAMCHAVRGKMGVSFGPDLGTIHNWTKEDIMANILQPSLSISAGYELWEVELNSGESVQGIISSETPTAITLKNNGKADRTINRQDIKSLRSLNISAMRTDLNKNINKQQMADLLAFLRKN